MNLTAKAVSVCSGSQSKLAKKMMHFADDSLSGVIRQGHVANWLYGRRSVSPAMAVLMELAVDRAVMREQFHPKLYESHTRKPFVIDSREPDQALDQVNP